MKKEAILCLTLILIILPLSSGLELTLELKDGESLGLTQMPWTSVFDAYLARGGKLTIPLSNTWDDGNGNPWTGKEWNNIGEEFNFISRHPYISKEGVWDIDTKVTADREGESCKWEIVLKAHRNNRYPVYREDTLHILIDHESNDASIPGSCDGTDTPVTVTFKRDGGDGWFIAQGTVAISATDSRDKKSDANTCQKACENSFIDAIKIRGGNIRSKCTNGYNYDNKDSSYEYGADAYKNDILRKKGNLKNLPDELIWQPSQHESSGKLNGQDYCYNEYGAKGFNGNEERGSTDGVRKANLLSGDVSADNGAHDDCVCWFEPTCIDEDRDDYGSGDYTFMCPNQGKDCIDVESEVSFKNAKPYKEVKETLGEEVKISQAYENAMKGFLADLRLPSGHLPQKTSGDKDSYIADEINPGIEETINLYSDTYILGKESKWLSSCNDGIDNDCDGKVDCFDASCFPSRIRLWGGVSQQNVCEDTCGKACNDKFPETVGASCVTKNELSALRYKNPLNAIKDLPIKDYADCNANNICACELGGCKEVCQEEFNKVNKKIDGKDSHELFKPSEEAEEREKANGVCYLDKKSTSTLKDKINVYEKFASTEGPQEACCCDICEKTKDIITTPDGVLEKIKQWVGENVLHVPEGIVQKIEDAQIIPKKGSSESPYYYDSIIGTFRQDGDGKRRTLHALFCDEVVEHLLEVDKTGGDKPQKQYGLYSSVALLMLHKKKPGTFKPEEFTITADGKNYTIPTLAIHEDYKEGGLDLMSRASSFLTSEIGDNLFYYQVTEYTKEGCKACWPVPDIDENGKSHTKDKSFSYFVFSDMIEGSYYGKGYEVTPHNLEFFEEYELIYENPSYIYKFDQDRFENCTTEKITEPTLFTLSSEAKTITYENITFNFPQDSVSEEITINVTKITFNCTKDYKAYLSKAEEIDQATTLNLMIATKNWIEEPTLWEKVYRILTIWGRD